MNKEEFRVRCGLETTVLEVWLEQSWLVPDAGAPEPVFSEIDVARVHLIRDLQGDMGVNDQGVDVILHLVDQLHGLRRVVAQLHTQSRAPPGGA